jgi:heterodisulfide reductase subunit A
VPGNLLRRNGMPGNSSFNTGSADSLHAPKSIDESITQAQAAASRAVTLLAKEKIRVGGVVSHINPERCSGCLGCMDVCPFSAITYDHKEHTAVVNPALCKEFGACSSTCPSEAPVLMGFNNDQLYAQIKGALYA